MYQRLREGKNKWVGLLDKIQARKVKYKIDQPSNRSGFVYLLCLHSLGVGYYKLGISRDIGTRVSELRSELGSVEVLLLIETVYFKEVEKYLKLFYSDEIGDSMAQGFSGCSEAFLSKDFNLNQFEETALSTVDYKRLQPTKIKRPIAKIIDYRRLDVSEFNESADLENIIDMSRLFVYNKRGQTIPAGI